MTDPPAVQCPVPYSAYDRVVLAHGAGGRAMHTLIDGLFARLLGGPELQHEHDGALLQLTGPIVVTTDAFTVSPLFFPGGDIGRLAVCGTVNDLAMCGARPLHLAVAFVLEEGLPLADLERIVASMAEAAQEAGVSVVTGDTKVVERGKGDGVFITTTGLGVPHVAVGVAPIGPRRIAPDDVVLVSGPLGEHGLAVLSVREGFEHETRLRSDVAPVAAQVTALLDAGVELHCLRDPTRGGLASALCELSRSSGLAMCLEERAIPFCSEVRDGCELLGLDPLHVASEGRFVAVLPRRDASRTLSVLAQNGCPDAAVIGAVLPERTGRVTMQSPIGGERVLDMPSGEPLPRIC